MGESRPSPLFESLSQRELEILRLMKEGFTNGEIARSLYLSLDTVKWYNHQIFGKLGVNNRTRAIEQAREFGLLHIPANELCVESNLPGHNLPAAINTLIGRVKMQKELLALLRSACPRLVTVYGPGGIGKTRLAIETARKALPDFPNGVWLVDLSPVNDSKLVPQLVADALGLHSDGKQTPEDALVRYLRSRKLLLIIDNCEHLLEACALLIALLLPSCPELRILATSREVLGVEGEALYPVLPLSFPDPHNARDVKALKRYDAVQLFVERAVSVQPGFTITQENARDIALICQRLDGIPLALELAAAQVNFLSVAQVAARLDGCFRLLIGRGHAILPRHQTMRAVLDWSYNLLNEPEQVLLRRLAVFTGRWTLEAAERVCADGTLENILDVLGQLVNKSMVIVFPTEGLEQKGETNDTVRYCLLEPVRQYMLEKLEHAGEKEALRDRHLAYYRHRAEDTMPRPYQGKWCKQYRLLKHDLNNLRSALNWGLADAGSPRVEDGLRLSGALHAFWVQAGRNREGMAWLEKALALSDRRGHSYDQQRARMLETNGRLEGLQANYWEAKRMLEESVALYRACGDDWCLAQALAHLALWSYPIDQPRSREASEEGVAIARKVGDPLLLAEVLMWRGDIASMDEDRSSSARYCQESMDLFLRSGERGEACYPISLLGGIAVVQGDMTAALNYRDDYLRYRPELDDQSIDYYFAGLMFVILYLLGNYKEMEAYAQKLLDQNLDQNQGAALYALRNMGIALKCQGKYSRSAACYEQSICLSEEVNDDYGICSDIAGLAGILALTGQPYRAARLFGALDTWMNAIRRKLDWGQERGELERGIADARGALSAEDFAQAWEEGSQFSREETIREGHRVALALVR